MRFQNGFINSAFIGSESNSDEPSYMDLKIMSDTWESLNNPLYSDVGVFATPYNNTQAAIDNPLYRDFVGDSADAFYHEPKTLYSDSSNHTYTLGEEITGEYQTIGPNGEILSVPMERGHYTLGSANIVEANESPYTLATEYAITDSDGNAFSMPLESESPYSAVSSSATDPTSTNYLQLAKAGNGYAEISSKQAEYLGIYQQHALYGAGNSNDEYLTIDDVALRSETTFSVPTESGEYMRVSSSGQHRHIEGVNYTLPVHIKAPGYEKLHINDLGNDTRRGAADA